MKTFWLTGLDDRIEENGDNEKEFQKLIEPDNKHRESGDCDNVTIPDHAHHIKVASESEGKVSVADSGIVVDKPHEDTHDADGTVAYKASLEDFDHDSEDSSSSDDLIIFKEGSAPRHSISFVPQRSDSIASVRNNKPNGIDLPKTVIPIRLDTRVHPVDDDSAIRPRTANKHKPLFNSNSFKNQGRTCSTEPKKQRHSFSLGQKLLRRKSEQTPRLVHTSKTSLAASRISGKRKTSPDTTLSVNTEQNTKDRKVNSPPLAQTTVTSASPPLSKRSSSSSSTSDTDDVPDQIPGFTDTIDTFRYDARTRTSIFTVPYRVSATDFMSPQNHWFDTKM